MGTFFPFQELELFTLGGFRLPYNDLRKDVSFSFRVMHNFQESSGDCSSVGANVLSVYIISKSHLLMTTLVATKTLLIVFTHIILMNVFGAAAES